MVDLTQVMYVEDEPDIQVIAQIALEDIGGFKLKICSSGTEALREAVAYQPQIFLLDMMMPDMTGIETMKALHQLPELAEIPVIFMTAKVQLHEVEHYMSLGAIGVIPKPFDAMTLADQIREIWNINENQNHARKAASAH